MRVAWCGVGDVWRSGLHYSFDTRRAVWTRRSGRFATVRQGILAGSVVTPSCNKLRPKAIGRKDAIFNERVNARRVCKVGALAWSESDNRVSETVFVIGRRSCVFETGWQSAP